MIKWKSTNGRKFFYIKTMVYILTTFSGDLGWAKASKAFLNIDTLLWSDVLWEKCDHEMRQLQFPISCGLLAIHAQKLGYNEMHVNLDLWCLNQISFWSVSDEDALLLQMYFPKCHYRWVTMKSGKSLTATDTRRQQPSDGIFYGQQKKLVRFLYLKEGNESSNTIK